MLEPKEFTAQIAKDCEELYKYHENSVKEFMESNPTNEEFVQYFTNRMINERINCTEISRRVSNLDMNTPAEDMFILSKQAFDEAKHFRMVKEIVEFYKGSDVDVEAAMAASREREKQGGDIRPATLLEKFEASEDPLSIAVYQYIAEGMAARNWAMQAETSSEEFVRSRYEEIAKDERFHSNIGKRSLEQLVMDPDTQARARKIADEVINLLWNIGCIAQHVPVHAMDELTV